jgi:signal peptidase II
MAKNKASMWPWLALALAIVLVDQLTKWLILGYYQLGDSTYVTSFFNIVRVHNTGAPSLSWPTPGAGSAGSSPAERGGDDRHPVDAALPPNQKLFCFALACILGGAIGNVIDRVVHGYVVDFLDFHWSFLAGLFLAGTSRPSTWPTPASPSVRCP